jgi:hypothetical protein
MSRRRRPILSLAGTDCAYWAVVKHSGWADYLWERMWRWQQERRDE